MKVTVPCTARPVRCGTEAWSLQLHLAGHGHDVAAAAESLRRAAHAWCVGLAACGQLERCLAERGLSWTSDDEGVLVQVLVVNQPAEEALAR